MWAVLFMCLLVCNAVIRVDACHGITLYWLCSEGTDQILEAHLKTGKLRVTVYFYYNVNLTVISNMAWYTIYSEMWNLFTAAVEKAVTRNYV